MEALIHGLPAVWGVGELLAVKLQQNLANVFIHSKKGPYSYSKFHQSRTSSVPVRFFVFTAITYGRL